MATERRGDGGGGRWGACGDDLSAGRAREGSRARVKASQIEPCLDHDCTMIAPVPCAKSYPDQFE